MQRVCDPGTVPNTYVLLDMNVRAVQILTHTTLVTVHCCHTVCDRVRVQCVGETKLRPEFVPELLAQLIRLCSVSTLSDIQHLPYIQAFNSPCSFAQGSHFLWWDICMDICRTFPLSHLYCPLLWAYVLALPCPTLLQIGQAGVLEFRVRLGKMGEKMCAENGTKSWFALIFQLCHNKSSSSSEQF